MFETSYYETWLNEWDILNKATKMITSIAADIGIADQLCEW
jgi:hypothetical protein